VLYIIVGPFPFESKMLVGMGMTTQAEQYGLYVSLLAPVFGSVLPLRKAYYINKYVHETDPEMKIMIAGKANLSESEKLASNAFLKNYKAVPRRLVGIPATFILFEIVSLGYTKFKKYWYVAKP
jgi:hypothetical protein